MNKLTKAQLIAGNQTTQTVNFKEIGGSLELRPLTSGQWSRVQAMEFVGLSFTGDDLEDSTSMRMEFSMQDTVLGRFEAACLAVSLSIVDDEEWSPEDVSKISPVSAIYEIYDKVKEISGVTEDMEDLMRRFRGDKGRKRHSRSTSKRDTSGDHSSGSDSPPASLHGDSARAS